MPYFFKMGYKAYNIGSNEYLYTCGGTDARFIVGMLDISNNAAPN